MPTKKFARYPFCLSKFQPTAEELADARTLIASFGRAERNAQTMHMKGYCKRNESEEHKTMFASSMNNLWMNVWRMILRYQ